MFFFKFNITGDEFFIDFMILNSNQILTNVYLYIFYRAKQMNLKFNNMPSSEQKESKSQNWIKKNFSIFNCLLNFDVLIVLNKMEQSRIIYKWVTVTGNVQNQILSY